MVRPPPPPPSPPRVAKTAATSARQRQFRRLTVRMSAEIRTARSVFTATTRDLSEGGAGLVSDRAMDEGAEIALGLFLVVDDVEEQMPPLWVKARVVWNSDQEKGSHIAGVRFEGMSEDQKTWLRHVLEHLPAGDAAKK